MRYFKKEVKLFAILFVMKFGSLIKKKLLTFSNIYIIMLCINSNWNNNDLAVFVVIEINCFVSK